MNTIVYERGRTVLYCTVRVGLSSVTSIRTVSYHCKVHGHSTIHYGADVRTITRSVTVQVHSSHTCASARKEFQSSQHVRSVVGALVILCPRCFLMFERMAIQAVEASFYI